MQTTSKKSKKKVVGASLLAGAALLSGVGAFAVFSDSESASRAIDAGQLDITLGPDASIADMAPGDIWSRPLTLDIPTADNDGDLIESITLALNPGGNEVLGQEVDNGVAVGPQSSLYSGADGLRLVLQNCDDAAGWTVVSPGIYDCAGIVTDIEGNAGGAAITDITDITADTKIDTLTGTTSYTAANFGVSPTATGTIPDGTTLNLLTTFVLPDTADNSYENAALPELAYEATANQRAGIER